MNRLPFVIFALLFSISVQAQTSKIVTGTLVDQRTNGEADKVELTLSSTTGKAKFTTESDGDGKFVFKNIPIGKYKLHVTDKDYMDIKQDVELNEKHHAKNTRIRPAFNHTSIVDKSTKISNLTTIALMSIN